MTTPGRRLVVAALVLLVCGVIGGLLAVATGVNTWGEAWGFDTSFTVPLPVGVVQLVLAWLVARDVPPPVGLVGFLFWGVAWEVVLLLVTAVVGLLAAARARQLPRARG